MSYDSTIEDMVDDVRDYLNTNAPTFVSSINSAKGDGTALSAFTEIVVSDQDPYAVSKYPRVQLFVENLETEHISSGYDSATMTFIGLVAINDKVDQRKKLLRYTEAVRQALRDHHDLGDDAFDVDPRGMTITYYPTEPDLGIGVSTLRFRVYKDIPN